VLRCPALAGRIIGVSRNVDPLVRHVLISRCPPPDQSGGAHTRTSAPTARNRTASPTSGSSRRLPSVDNKDTHVVAPCLCPFLVRPPILRPDPGLAASPPVRYTLEVARSEISLPLPLSSAGTDNLLAKRRCATAPRHPTGSPGSWPGCPAAPTRSSSRDAEEIRSSAICRQGVGCATFSLSPHVNHLPCRTVTAPRSAGSHATITSS
jgi:hypothetical protein